MMGQQNHLARSSWLSLVAETAGVSGATVARVELCARMPEGQSPHQPAHAVVQILDDFGRVIAAAAWEGESRELERGVCLDVGCDLGSAWGSLVVAWIEPGSRSRRPELVTAPKDAAARYFEPTRAMKLMLAEPSPVSVQLRELVPMEAA